MGQEKSFKPPTVNGGVSKESVFKLYITNHALQGVDPEIISWHSRPLGPHLSRPKGQRRREYLSKTPTINGRVGENSAFNLHLTLNRAPYDVGAG
ncbi:MAG: hypothetical protein U5L09_00585 [Bacteroidales bacterium]|nr:hypothetical protein [Bacteroidales bacterium]